MVTIRVRSVMWFVAGLTLALASLWSWSTWRAEALPGPSESTIVNVTPERVLDSRDPVDLGLPGPFVSQVPQKLQITGSIPTATGTKTVVPTGATGVLLNVTGFNASANGFISIRPGDATGAPTTSSLNVLAGETVPNAVQVSLPTAGPNAGQIDIVYDALGVVGPMTDIFIDVVGYTTNTGLQDVNTQLGQVNTQLGDRYTKAEVDTQLGQVNTQLGQKADTTSLPRIASSTRGGFPSLSHNESLTTVSITVPPGPKQNVFITADASILTNETQADTCNSTTACNIGIAIYDADTNTQLTPNNGSVYRLLNDNEGQALAISVVVSASPGTHTYRLQTDFNLVKPEVAFLNHANLTAMTIPLTGTGTAPARPFEAPAAAAANPTIGD